MSAKNDTWTAVILNWAAVAIRRLLLPVRAVEGCRTHCCERGSPAEPSLRPRYYQRYEQRKECSYPCGYGFSIVEASTVERADRTAPSIHSFHNPASTTSGGAAPSSVTTRTRPA